MKILTKFLFKDNGFQNNPVIPTPIQPAFFDTNLQEWGVAGRGENPTNEMSGVLPYNEHSGYPRVIRCGCGANFRYWKSFKKHHETMHSGSYDYELVTVDSGYLKERMVKCKTQQIIFSHLDECCYHTLITLNSCYLRCCPKCEATRKNRYAKLFKNAVFNFQRVAVVTLTLKNHHPLTKQQMGAFRNDVKNFMRRLRRNKNYPIQYIRVLEVVEKFDGWYYHFHLLVDMPYIRQDNLSKIWNDVSGSSVVWVEIAKNNNGVPIGHIWGRLPNRLKFSNALRYVSKYLAKPLPSLDLDAYAVHIYGQHFTQTLTRSNGQKCAIKTGLICKECGGLLHFSGCETIVSADSEKTRDYQMSLSEVLT